MKKFKNLFFLALVSLCIIFTSSCKGINRGEGYVFSWSEYDNYARITISDTEYIHFHRNEHIGEWVVGDKSSPIAITSVFFPIRNADAYRLYRYNTENDVDFAKIDLGFDVSEDIISESFYLENPDREKGIIHITNESTKDVIYASKVETSYQENIDFSITSSQWKDFINYDDSTVYQSLEHSFWYSPNTGVGEWKVNDIVIQIEIELLRHGPGIKIYDISNGDKKLILYAAGALSNNDTLILDCIDGDMFYNNSVESLTLTKTTEQTFSAPKGA
ncbi:MAG: hypothetical protein IJY56_00620 [Clostridia bacterium]|nr:hypothetical protein [Clostridia bacterium]